MIETLRREPFRALFPVGVLIAWIGISPWLLFGTGLMRAWPGMFHALTMTQGFLMAIAIGFLGTMIPRRTGARPMSAGELLIAIVGLVTIPVAGAVGRLAVAEAAYLVVVIVLAQFAVRRMRTNASALPIPPSFLFIPVGLLAAATGAVFLFTFAIDGPAWTLALGRSLVQEGVLLSFVLALTPMLSPIILHDGKPDEWSPARLRRARGLHALAAVTVLASFVVEHAVSIRLGLATRAVVLTVEMIWAARLTESPRSPGLHRRLYRLALLFIPLGPLAAMAQPAMRIPSLHLTFVGGFSLLVFAVSLHVAFLHTARESLAKRSPRVVLVIAILTVLATCARFFAERFTQHYFEALTVASFLWLAAAFVWGVYLIGMVTRRATVET